MEMRNEFHAAVSLCVFPLDGNLNVSNIQLVLDCMQSVQFG